MFRHVPSCSGMFRVPGFIDAQENVRLDYLVFNLMNEKQLSFSWN